jgi:hypothetical protein
MYNLLTLYALANKSAMIESIDKIKKTPASLYIKYKGREFGFPVVPP